MNRRHIGVPVRIPPIDQSCVGYFKLSDDYTQLIDKTSYGNDAAVLGDLYNTYGFGGYCLWSDGNTYVNLGNAPQYTFTGSSFTMSCWVYYGYGLDSMIFFEKYSLSFMGYCLYNSTSEYFAFAMDTDQDFYVVSYEGNYQDWTYAWHHVAVVVNNDTKKIYLYADGKKVKEQAYAGNVVTNTNPLAIGGLDPGYRYTGAIDEARLYNRALSDTEIADLYMAFRRFI